MSAYANVTVLPGQRIAPLEIDQDGTLLKFIPGSGTVALASGVAATVLGTTIVQEIRAPEPAAKDTKSHRKVLRNAQKPVKNILISVAKPGTSAYASYASEIDVSAADAVDATATNLPRVGDAVFVRITRLSAKQAFCDLLCVCGFGNMASDSGVGSTGTLAHVLVPTGGGAQLLLSYNAVAAAQNGLAAAQPVDVGELFRGVIRAVDVRLTDRDKVKVGDSFRPGDIVKAEVLSLGDGSNYYLTTARNDLGVVFARSEGGAGHEMLAIDWETMVCTATGALERRKCAKVT